MCISLACDVADRSAIDDAYAKVSANEEKVHLLVNNSGATWGAVKGLNMPDVYLSGTPEPLEQQHSSQAGALQKG